MEIQDGGCMVVTNHFRSLGKNQINQRAAAFRGGWLRKHAQFSSEDTATQSGKGRSYFIEVPLHSSQNRKKQTIKNPNPSKDVEEREPLNAETVFSVVTVANNMGDPQ